MSLLLQDSVGNKGREMNKIYSGNLYPFSLESIVENILATRHFSVTADLRICKVYHTLDLRYLRGDISTVNFRNV